MNKPTEEVKKEQTHIAGKRNMKKKIERKKERKKCEQQRSEIAK